MLPHLNVILEAIPRNQEKYLEGSAALEIPFKCSLVKLRKDNNMFSVAIRLPLGLEMCDYFSSLVKRYGER